MDKKFYYKKLYPFQDAILDCINKLETGFYLSGGTVAIDEMEWLRAAAANPAFDFLKEPEEDIYTLADFFCKKMIFS